MKKYGEVSTLSSRGLSIFTYRDCAKSGDIDYKRKEIVNNANNSIKSNDSFESICAKAREIHKLNKQKEKLYQGN